MRQSYRGRYGTERWGRILGGKGGTGGEERWGRILGGKGRIGVRYRRRGEMG